MVFEIGKFYKHNNANSYLAIIQEVETTLYGKGLLAEDEYGNLLVAGKDKESAINWNETTKEDWLTNFS